MRLAGMMIAVALLIPAGAAAQDVSVDFDKTFDFSKLKTFSIKWNATPGNPLAERRVIAEVQEELTGKGWKTAPEATADAVVVLNGATQTKHSINTFYSGGYGGYRWGGMGTGTTTVYEYTVGTLVVDIFDAKSKNLVFRGNATDELSKNPDKNMKKVDKATDKMFKNFPPTKK